MGWLLAFLSFTLLCLFTLLVALVLLFKGWSRLEPVGSFLIAQMTLKESAFEVCPLIVQLAGFLNNTAILTFPFTIAVRYSYYFWVVVLEREVRRFRWVSLCLTFWLLVLVLSFAQAYQSLFHYRANLQCTSPFFLDSLVVELNAAFYLATIVAGGVTLLFVANLILGKFNTSTSSLKEDPDLPGSPLTPGDRKISRRSIMRKVIPVTVAYIISHIPFMAFVLSELILVRPASPALQYTYSFTYTFFSLVAPMLIVYNNRCMFEAFKSILGCGSP
ncbi:hypothetical protein L0F63_000169 [Massospora cicadina]|nr:hypothetical protein L0F63_000169 [Massospora cicadina]